MAQGRESKYLNILKLQEIERRDDLSRRSVMV
jgi:hypothetical protein